MDAFPDIPRFRSPIGACLAIAAAVALALPAGAPAKGGLVDEVAVQACAKLKRQIGSRAFHRRYGERRAFTSCVRRMRRGEARQAVEAATKECEFELWDAGLEGFLEDWDSLAECIDAYARIRAGVPVDTDEEDDSDEIDVEPWW